MVCTVTVCARSVCSHFAAQNSPLSMTKAEGYTRELKRIQSGGASQENGYFLRELSMKSFSVSSSLKLCCSIIFGENTFNKENSL